MRNVFNETALILAVENEEKEIVDLLINDDRFVPQENLLNCAFIYSNNEICDQLYSLSYLDVNETFSMRKQSLEKTNYCLFFFFFFCLRDSIKLFSSSILVFNCWILASLAFIV